MTSSTEEWDVVVVGAGPAGSISAGLLARRGHRVLLCDRSPFPRRKPCGESINPGAVRELRKLGLLERVMQEPHRRICGWRISGTGNRVFEGHFLDSEAGIGMARSRFDAVLARWAVEEGAVMRAPEKIADLIGEGSTTRGVKTAGGSELRARLVIGADGLRSVVVRRLGLISRPPRLRKVALTAHMTALRPMDLGALHSTAWGCAGIASIEEALLNVVLVLTEGSSELEQLSSLGPQVLFDQLAAGVPALAEATRVGEVLTTGPFDYPTRAVVADGALLVGDAAGYFDPFTGQGIYRALRGAGLAAEVADQCLARGDCSTRALNAYERAHNEAFASGVRLQHAIEAVISRPRLFGGAAKVLAAFPAVADRLVGVTGDQLPLRSLLPGMR